jgi:hypothetical protein
MSADWHGRPPDGFSAYRSGLKRRQSNLEYLSKPSKNEELVNYRDRMRF